MSDKEIIEKAMELFPNSENKLIALDEYAQQLFKEVIKTERRSSEYLRKVDYYNRVRKLYQNEYERMAAETVAAENYYI